MSDRIRQCCVFSDAEQELTSTLVGRLVEMGCNVLFHLQKPSKETVINKLMEKTDPSKQKKLLRMTRDKFVFVLQAPSQTTMLRKYGGVVYIVEANQNNNINATRTLTFRVQLLFVQTNVDFQLVGCFMYSKQQVDGFETCMRTYKNWNKWWSPKYFITEIDETITEATTTLFPGENYCFSCGNSFFFFSGSSVKYYSALKLLRIKYCSLDERDNTEITDKVKLTVYDSKYTFL